MANDVRFLVTDVCIGIGEGVGFGVRTLGNVTSVLLDILKSQKSICISVWISETSSYRLYVAKDVRSLMTVV